MVYTILTYHCNTFKIRSVFFVAIALDVSKETTSLK